MLSLTHGRGDGNYPYVQLGSWSLSPTSSRGVTGKDGGSGSGNGNETKLSRVITELPDFQQAIDAAELRLRESGGDVTQVLGKLKQESTLKNIIDQLTNGLKGFIGYGGGQGIADLVDPLQQLRKGVLMFLIEVIRKLKDNFRHTKVRDSKGVMNELIKAMNNSKDNFDTVILKVDGIDGGNVVNSVVSALKKVVELTNKQNTASEFAGAVKTFLTGLLKAAKNHADSASDHVENLCTNLSTLVTAYGENSSDFATKLSQVENANDSIKSLPSKQPAKALVEGIYYGTKEILSQLKKDGYKSSYSSTSNWSGSADNTKTAQIFLGCLPLYYYWLTYLYWKCREKGDWAGQILSRPTLKNFMVGMGYNASHLTTNGGFKGSNIATLLENSYNFSTATATSNVKSHTDLLNTLKEKLNGALNASVSHSSGSTNELNGHSLSALFQLCRCYFTGKHMAQSKDRTFKPKPPTSIREMLYWLSGLQFSPHYSSIEQQIDGHIPSGGLRVADSSIPSTSKSSGDTLTQSQMKGFLLSSCLSAPGVLGTIQGNSADTDGKPWLHSLFCNTMNLQYPSGSALFNTLANYAYALQFQLLFLYAQCRSWYSQSLGWQWCRYGHSIQTSGNDSEESASWICKASNCQNQGCPHNSSSCLHIQQCGTQGKPSPLQAFLTDKLKGFSRHNPSESSDHLATCSGYLCHVPMGFDGTLTKDTNATGWNIYYLLDHSCGFSYGPLRQLSEKLSCLTKRTPRNLGDVFGFMWHLNGQLFRDRTVITSLDQAIQSKPKTLKGLIDGFQTVLNKDKTTFRLQQSSQFGLSDSLKSIAKSLPFWEYLFDHKLSDGLPGKLFDLKQHCHKWDRSGQLKHQSHDSSGLTCSNPADLWSLCKPVTDPIKNHKECASGNCGGYLYPLTHTFGSAFAPKHASAYLSWVLYLTDDLEIGLQEMLDAFKNIDCQTSGCQKPCKSHHPGQHGTSADCSCDSVVHCAGVLPLYYEYGFTMFYASTLKTTAKRTCQQFHNQLKAVIKGNPVRTILTAIDDFLYLFRIYFFYNLSTFWILYVCIVLYIYFFRADLLHLKSHARFPSSHDISSIGLLPTGKPTVLTKVTKLTYFMP
ncbi:variant erythrocyte surface antigen-1 family protein [Babesia caballi]|uniref:Variant erythrocyte surface antigen-1 family protein n=1 Tax=Babesia caballi TaxID=5871 RepID=A0AAV4LUL5_BABCB|nr:variant erythrocyte surface antigen-1 family protein [Babesia caballi]